MSESHPEVRVPPGRIARWVENFERRHGRATLSVADGSLTGLAEDGSTFTARLPFAMAYGGDADAGALADAARPPADWGVLLVRKGGFAVARLNGDDLVAHKVGQRHVQGRTKAGGQSQQRFARRRANQARIAYEAAAEHAARILDGLDGPVVVGGDRAAIDDVLRDSRLNQFLVVGPWLAVPDPKRATLDQAIRDAASLTVTVDNVV